jgi:hypothetical protein
MFQRLFGWLRPAGPEPATIYHPKLINDFEQVDSFLSTYYLKPMPELVWQLLDFLGTGDNGQQGLPAIAGFLSEFLVAHPGRKAQLKSLAYSKSVFLRNAFLIAVRLSRRPGRGLAIKGHAGYLNDLRWGAYYASGDPRYIDRLVDEMRFSDESSDPFLYLAGATAKWSLACHAITHESVNQHLQALSREGRIGEFIDEVLTCNPSLLQAEMEITCRARGWFDARATGTRGPTIIGPETYDVE